MITTKRPPQSGQAIALFALALTAIVLAAAVVVDGGYAFAQRRQAQNAADFAAMAGTRIVGISLTGEPPGAGSAANVESAVRSTLAANDSQIVRAQYVDEGGYALGDVVGATRIPDGAFGVVVEARTNWKPFLLGVIGVTDWAATASATALTPGEASGGAILPVGINQSAYDAMDSCDTQAYASCLEQPLTPGNNINEGSMGWLKLGLNGPGGSCGWTNSLGMVDDGGCDNDRGFLQSQIWPDPDTHGCCTAVGLGGEDKIGAEVSNKWADLSHYMNPPIPVWVPIYKDDPLQPVGTGQDAYYDIVGFGAIVFLGQSGEQEHSKWLKGAAIETPWCAVTDLDGTTHDYCAGPGSSFKFGVTGEVQLRR